MQQLILLSISVTFSIISAQNDASSDAFQPFALRDKEATSNPVDQTKKLTTAIDGTYTKSNDNVSNEINKSISNISSSIFPTLNTTTTEPVTTTTTAPVTTTTK